MKVLLLALVLIVLSNEIRDLEPKVFWKEFFDLSQIPRCSYKEKRIREEYIQKFADTNGFKMKTDKYGNCLVEVPATPGKEGKPKLVLQSHLDMVCEKNRESNHNFDKDPLNLIFSRESKDWIVANGTTLGADDGMGIASSIGLVLDKTVVHGPLELLFTVEEEIGLVGAQKLEPGFVSGTVLVNIDSGTEGQITVGCAGGQRFETKIPKAMVSRTGNFNTYEIQIKGLVGGHSGKDINSGRANSLKILGRLLKRLQEHIRFEVNSLSAGSSANAIPRESSTMISFDPALESRVRTILKEFTDEVKSEFKVTEPNMFTTFDKQSNPIPTIIRPDVISKVINLIQIAPHGVVEMSREIPGLVETSLNFASVNSQSDNILFVWSIRSSIDSAKENVATTLKSITELTGGTYQVLSNYAGWRPNFSSELIAVSKRCYQRLFGNEPTIKAVHAGLEPGIIGKIYPQLAANMIAIGPNIIDNHSPAEKVQVSSVQKLYPFVKAIVMEYAK